MSCSRCNGSGFLTTSSGGNKLCPCKIAENIKEALSSQPNVLLARDKQINKELFKLNTVISSSNMESVYSILKVMFTFYYIKGSVKRLDIIDSDSIMEAYFEKSTSYSMTSIKESDFLVICIEEGSNNKILPDVVKSIVNYRDKIYQGKPTWIVFSSFKGTKMKEVSMFSDLVQYFNNLKFPFLSIK